MHNRRYFVVVANGTNNGVVQTLAFQLAYRSRGHNVNHIYSMQLVSDLMPGRWNGPASSPRIDPSVFAIQL